MKLVYLSTFLLAGIAGAVHSQEFRKPDEITEIVIKSTYTSYPASEFTPDEKLYVWVGYRPIWKWKTTPEEEGYHHVGFWADKLLIYRDGRLVREISDLKDMPDPKSIKSEYIGYDLRVFPHLSEQEDGNKIVLSSAAGNFLLGLGFKRNEMTLGPFPYQVNFVWTRVQADKGLVYVKAHCGDKYYEAKKRRAVNPFSVLYILDRELKLLDSFIFDKGMKKDKYELYPSGGKVYLTGTGDLRQVKIEKSAKHLNIKIKKWRLTKN